MTVLLFLPRFHDLVECGVKRQTIRAPRKRPVRPGESLSLRAWTGSPYRSPQRELISGVCYAVEPIRIDRAAHGLAVELTGVRLSKIAVAALAIADGFDGVGEMRLHYTVNRAMPFEGVLIRWEPTRC